jgi:predicted porin
MQKKLIAAAVAGLIAVPALAQTNVTISGRLSAGWESYKLSGPGTGYDTESRVSDQSSRLIFNVVEDLGGGLSAWGQFDYRGSLDNGALNNNGNSGVGLMHKSWGKFTIGHWDVHYQEIDAAIGGNRAGSLQTLLGNGIMSQVSGNNAFGVIANGTRTANLLMWDSPNWNGFTARLGYSTGFATLSNEGNTNRAAGDPGGGRAWTGAVRYNNGPWTAGLSYWNGNVENRVPAVVVGDQRSTRAWLGYTFAMGLKLGIAYDRSKLTNAGVGGGDLSRGAWMIPVSYGFGPHKVYFQYARAGDASNTANNSGAKAWNIGYDYAFSKRTSAGIFYTKLNNDKGGAYDMFAVPGGNGATATALGGGEDARQIYIGLAHNF